MLAPSKASTRELELKFELPADDFRRLSEAPFLKVSKGRSSHRTLRSIYFDTPGHDLAQARIALRLRDDGEKKWLQTVKSGEAANGLADVGQIEARVEKCEPDLDSIADRKLRRKIRKICYKAELKPAFETIVDRAAYAITEGDSSAELALDECRIEASGQSASFREVELELLSGSPEDLLAMAKELFSDFGIRPSKSSKAARGYSLLRHEPEISHALHAQPITLRRNEPARDAFAAILQSAAQHIIANQRVVLDTGEAEGVHQMRVGLTRLRAAIRSIKPFVKAPWVTELESDAQNLARAVGALRDADVLISEIYAPIAEQHGKDTLGFHGLLQALKAHRDRVYKEAAGSFDKGIWPRFLVTLILSPYLIGTGGSLEDPAAAVARDSLERRWKKVRTYGARIDDLTLEERHSMRKALKKLRYNCEFFQALYKRKAPGFTKRLKKMQELFGAINDVRMAKRLVELAAEHRRKDPKALAAAGYILGRHEAHAPLVWGKAKHEWERLEKASGFWR